MGTAIATELGGTVAAGTCVLTTTESRRLLSTTTLGVTVEGVDPDTASTAASSDTFITDLASSGNLPSEVTVSSVAVTTTTTTSSSDENLSVGSSASALAMMTSFM